MAERHEYYWHEGRVREYVNTRAGNRGRWHRGLYGPEELIVSVQQLRNRGEFKEGPQSTPDRLAEAITRYYRHHVDPLAVDIGAVVPDGLRSEVAYNLSRIARDAAELHELSGNEEGMSGYLGGSINRMGAFRSGPWEVSLRVQVFSPQTKEPRVGADLGVIVDIRQGDSRVVKAALIQAKRVERPVSQPMKLPDLADQLAKMQRTTKESYGMIYSDEETYIFQPDDSESRINVGGFFSDIIVCRRGDRRHRAVAQAYDRSTVVDVTLTGARVQ